MPYTMIEEVEEFLINLKEKYYHNLGRKTQKELEYLCDSIQNLQKDVRDSNGI